MNSEQFLDVIYGAIKNSKDVPQLFMATVGANDNTITPAGAKVFLKFDGTTSYSTAASYPILDSAYPLSIDQRVLVARIAGTYLVVGKVKKYT
ncbi:hypothetical protein [Bacillus thuringiensis]|uniref:hypothetical protein n=1 Tax=Bacillus thuringiensis TaxID=1428 RepID=UPI0011AA8A91|nr:hypothetical protein [Bacillus thuringiensis]